MDKDREDTLLAFAEWLDKEFDGYMLLSTRDGKSSMICNGDDKHIKAALATAIQKYPYIKGLVGDSLRIAGCLEDNKRLN